MNKCETWRKVERFLIKNAKELLKIHPDRRGPYIITDQELMAVIACEHAPADKEEKK